MLNLDKKQKYLLACSFGPDSMALAEMLRREKYNFSIAHVNYHLREESSLETEGLKQYCKKYDIELFIHEVEEPITTNVEEKCREIRYHFFYEIMSSHPNTFYALLVAHQQDDLLETYLLQKKRNILPSYYGLPEKTTLFGMLVIRPLLAYKKARVIEICKENDVPYGLDSTNFLDIYARNKIRHEIIEKMSDDDRKKMLEEIKKENDKLQEAYRSVENFHDLSNAEILKLHPIEYRLYLNSLAKEVQSDFTVSQKVANEIRKVLLSDKPNVVTPVTKDLVFVKEYETSYFDFTNSQYDFLYVLDKGDKLDTSYFYLDFSNDATNRGVKESDYPIVIRNAKKEDIYFIKGYPVKVRRLFIDWKMPLSLRKRWPVILNKDNDIIYIPRYQKDFIPDETCNFYVKKRFSLKKG